MPRARRPSAAPAAGAERVQKILARAGLASRREAEEWIRAGRVSINGETAITIRADRLPTTGS